MRLTVIVLVALSILCFAIAAFMTGSGRTSGSAEVVASGVVKELADGPHHAIVEVVTPSGTRFTFPANTEEGLAPSQRVTVRYMPDAPLATAHVVTAGDDGTGNGTVRTLYILGFILLAAALLSPLLVRWAPGVFAFRVRP